MERMKIMTRYLLLENALGDLERVMKMLDHALPGWRKSDVFEPLTKQMGLLVEKY
jgi:hypothetical protein